ncbi:hypothetical protein BDY17DRAFT_308012 [Neohortaea acidophila]|uniref:Nudix hydrolase domain-containing protein n=1 Tax=Neohortaea acidophila TaxID=245834 RepID=A0A6A6Q218_9PEZI|nr:uncharacterized protein BDY17DRAFT_308012 [Neohortaea acidophila]KAF2486558.1 hypothetical protein BDY17DRAFT_308012 [Neohortaea acidophila]
MHPRKLRRMLRAADVIQSAPASTSLIHSQPNTDPFLSQQSTPNSSPSHARHGPNMPAHPSFPTTASFPSEKLTLAAGIAIFHLATARVVLCHHSRDKYWFLPKGRKNAGEELPAAAEREGFEESGYRNRVLPLPFKHRATHDEGRGREAFVTEPVWMQLLPLSETVQYVLFWFVGETVSEGMEGEGAGAGRGYSAPVAFPKDVTLKERIGMDRRVGEDGKVVVYEPVRHANTGVDEEEQLYESFLVPVSEARRRLRGSVMEDVVRRGWDAVELRMRMEEGKGS